MVASKDHILIVENDPFISDFIGRQVLLSAGYQVFVVPDVNTAISKTKKIGPDLIITNINLPGLSGKDLIVALNSQGIDTPVIVISSKGQESEVIQTFRLGAVDYINWPAKEPEIIQSVERIIKQVHERRQRHALERKLKDINQQLQKRVRELTAIFSMGKAVTSITDQNILFEKINHVAAQVTMADFSWFLLREEKKEKQFLLVAQNNLPEKMADYLHQTWDDGISSLVAMSGESLNIHGDPIKRFPIKTIGNSILIVPVKVQRQVIGLLVVMRKKPNMFTNSEQNLLEAVADYASISLANARLFRAIEARAGALEGLAKKSQTNEKISREIIKSLSFNLAKVTENLQSDIDKLVEDESIDWNENQQTLINQIKDTITSFSDMSASTTAEAYDLKGANEQYVELTALAKMIFKKFEPVTKHFNLEFNLQVPDQPVYINCEKLHVLEILRGLLTNAIQFCQSDGKILLWVKYLSPTLAQISVSNSSAMPGTKIVNTFHKQPEQNEGKIRFGGIGISLDLINEILQYYDGKIRIDQNNELGTIFNISLPAIKVTTE